MAYGARERGQAMSEYVMIVGAIALAAAAVTTVIAKAWQAKVRSGIVTLTNVKGAGDLDGFKAFEAYAPWDTSSTADVKRESKYDEEYEEGTGKITFKNREFKATRKQGYVEKTSDATQLSQDDTWQ